LSIPKIIPKPIIPAPLDPLPLPLPVPKPLDPLPLPIPKPQDPLPLPEPKPQGADPVLAPKPDDPPPLLAPKPEDPAPPPAPKPQDPVSPPVAPQDIEPDEVALCKRSGCDLTPAIITKVKDNGAKLQKELDEAMGKSDQDVGSKIEVTNVYDRPDDVPLKELPVEAPSQGMPWITRVSQIKNEPEGWLISIVKNKPEDLTAAGMAPRKPILVTKQKPGKEGAIIISESFNKQQDLFHLDPSTGKKPMRWSDMVMDNWRVSSGAGVQDLRYIFRNNIEEADEEFNIPSTPKLIDEALKVRGKGGIDKDEDLFLNFPKASIGADKDAYNILAGSLHVDRVLKMLNDHRRELGDLNIESIAVVKQDEEYNLAILLKHGV
jgi:hypothetical protein